VFHSTSALGAIHVPYNWEYADQAAREAATGFVTADLGKLARQTDSNGLFMLVATTPTWIDVGGGGGSSAASQVVVPCRKSTAGTINKGQPVYLAGYGSGYVLVELVKADAVGTMPALGVSNDTITDSAQGNVVVFGKVENINTESWAINASLYVSAATAGLLVDTRPTGATSLIQAVARVTESHVSAGIITVMGAGRVNALPNIAEGKVWQGDSNGQPVESNLPVFGTRYQYAASEGESSNGTVTPVQKVRLTTPSLPAGDYRIAWFYEWMRDTAATSFEAKVELDDATVLSTHLTEQADATDWNPVAGFVVATLTAAAHTIDIDFWGESAVNTSYIRRARVEIWRIS